MFGFSHVLFRARSIHPRAFAAAAEAKMGELRRSVAATHDRLTRPVVLEDLEATVQVSESNAVSARDMWHASCVARESKHARRAQGACVVGGAKTIQRIWREYNIRPHVVYVPSTETAVPAWCVGDDLPTYLVRSSPVEIKRQLLSAEYSDGYAAEFPWDASLIAPTSSLFAEAPPSTDQDEATGDVLPPPRVRSMVVLVGLRIPSNAGMLIRAAVDMGYDTVLLIDCVDPFQEKVMRASEGTVFSPRVRIYEDEGAGDSVALLGAIAQRHRLLPILAVPSQEADPALDVAKRLHHHNAQARQAAQGQGDAEAVAGAPYGTMLVLGSESQGLDSLGESAWRVPHQVVTLPLPNPEIDSYNVTVAGSILLHMFRRDAEPHFSKLLELTGEARALAVGANDGSDNLGIA